MTEPSALDRNAPLRLAGLAALAAVLIAGIWALWGPSPWDRWQIALFPAAMLLGIARQLVRKPWSRLREGARIVEVLNDRTVEERPRLGAMVDAIGVTGLLIFLGLMSRWLAAEAQWVRLAALTPMTLATAGFVLLRLKQILRPG